MDGKTATFRLAVFTDTFDDVNGVAVIYRQLMAAAPRAPADAGDLTVFCPGAETGVERMVRGAVCRYRPRPRLSLPRYRLLKVGWVNRRRVVADFGRSRFDAVLVATPGPLGFIGKSLALQNGLPLIGFYHTRFPVYLAVYSRGIVPTSRGPLMAERMGYRIMRRLYGDCTMVLVQSIAMADEVARASAAQLGVWGTGVDLRSFAPGRADGFRAAHGVPIDATVVLYVGRVAAEKNLDVLAALSRRMPDLHFLVVGGGPYAETLQSIARATFTGFLTGPDLAEAYRAGDMFLFPSTTDTFGNVLIEAMASGLPLVVVDQGPPGELVARTGAGLTFPAGDLDAAEVAVRRLATHAVERAAMSAAAHAHAAVHDWPAAYTSFMALCRQAPMPVTDSGAG